MKTCIVDPYRKAAAVPLAWVPLEAILVRKRAELRARLRNRAPIEIERHLDPVDDAWSSVERDTATAIIDKETELLHAVEAALERMAGGTFGICDGCGEEISPARLAAVPWALRCKGCEEEWELAMAEEAGSRLGDEA